MKIVLEQTGYFESESILFLVEAEDRGVARLIMNDIEKLTDSIIDGEFDGDYETALGIIGLVHNAKVELIDKMEF